MLANKEKIKILAVDDEPLNLDILLEYFKDEGYQMISANDGLEAWQALQESDIDIIVLDRMMPNMDGITLLKKIKSIDKFKNTPVIMQTAASSVNEIKEGVEAGAFYYLSKPYKKEILLSIVRAAIEDVKKYKSLLSEMQSSCHAFNLITNAKLKFQTLEDISSISQILSQSCSMCLNKNIGWGLTELMINAVEHGNLGINYQEKRQLVIKGRWLEEINIRLAQDHYKDKFCKLEFTKNEEEIIILISDQGQGFTPDKYLDIDLKRVMDPNGRGIAIAKQTTFDEMKYLNNGNTVKCKIYLPS